MTWDDAEMTPLKKDIYGLHAGFLESVRRFPTRPALEVEGQVLTYAELRSHAAGIAAVLAAGVRPGAPLLAGVLANRSLPVYAGLLGTLMAGFGIVPLNPGFPPQRTRQMIDQAELEVLILDAKGESQLGEILADIGRSLQIVLPYTNDVEALRARWPQHRFVPASELVEPVGWEPVSVAPDSLAYLFFTSGSTGVPKGVGVLHRNTLRFVAMSVERYAVCGVSETDRFSQFYDITFDSSMFDLYVCWAFGGCLCSPSHVEWVNPNKYIIEKELTVIDIVPSTGHALNRTNGWRPGRFPRLRLCRFGGEALSADLAATLSAAAPNAIVENVYGPTECTVDAAYYRWKPDSSASECLHGIVPIGDAGPKVTLMIVDQGLEAVPIGEEGELLISGEQVTPGYWRNPERTAQAFVNIPHREGRYYRTGDLVRKLGVDRPIVFLGRLDHQIKIAGVRIELGEVEKALRDAAETDLAVALGWPLTSSGAAGIVGFIADPGANVDAIRGRLKHVLPSVMVPREIHLLASFPLNNNGKIDRKALLESLSD
ncbi:MAG: amino acid adenylation domain-containing protein [Azoarcus sp.]|nr:amino acid adenylation domain-containing protein [Azoarcus sp.]